MIGVKKGSMGQKLDDTEVAELRDIGLIEQLLGKQLTRVRHRRDKILAGRAKVDGLGVTDHAIVRFLERVEGVDMEAVKERMRTYETQCANTNIKGLRLHPDGHQVVVTPVGVVVTVLPPGYEFLREVF